MTLFSVVLVFCLIVFLALGTLYFFPSVGAIKAVYPERRLNLLKSHPWIGWLWLLSGCLPATAGVLLPAPWRTPNGHVLVGFACAGLVAFCINRVFPRLEYPAKVLSLLCFAVVALIAVVRNAG
jgi:hypothetical protein